MSQNVFGLREHNRACVEAKINKLSRDFRDTYSVRNKAAILQLIRPLQAQLKELTDPQLISSLTK